MYWMIGVAIVVVSIALPLVLAARALLPLVRATKQEALLQLNGARASGRILTASQTGLTVNDRPQFELTVLVEPEGADSFVASLKQLASLLEIPRIQPGERVQVVYDPADHSKVALAGDPAYGAVRSPEQERAQLVARLERNDRINERGLPATAIVLEFRDLNILVNGDNRVAELRVKVLAEGREPFEAAAHGIFMPSGLSRYQPGKELPVKYDPSDPSTVAVDHARVSIVKGGYPEE